MSGAIGFELVVLVILDGFGWRDASEDNAVKLAAKPHYDALWEHGPRGFLRVCGAEVGLPDGEPGDSETGHRNMGAGRLVWRTSPAGLPRLLGDVVAAAGRRQLRLAAADKLGHVTRALNGGRAEPAAGETHRAAVDVAGEAVAAIAGGLYHLIVVNIGDADVAGHTGDLARAVQAVEAVDGMLGRIAAAVRAAGGAMLITSDHGNCEMMRDPVTGRPHTGHTANDVPVILMAPGNYLFRDGRLADVAPTVLKLMGLPAPPEMTETPLLRGNLEAWSASQTQTELVTYVA